MKLFPYHAVEIICAPGSCNSCKRYQGKKVLSSEFEYLVLRNCSKGTCRSTFKHHPDRRSKFERRRFDGAPPSIVAHDRRLKYGRRAVDIHNRAKDKSKKLTLEKLMEIVALQQKET